MLVIWTSLSRNTADRMRSNATASLAPAWYLADRFRGYLSDRPIHGTKKEDPVELSQLELENQMLKSQVELAREWIFYEKGLEHKDKTLERRRSYLSDLLQRQSHALQARVIYRDPSSWSSSLWIHVGEEDNRAFGSAVISRNSPVVDGNALIGVVDYVGKRQSRVRLITDSGLTPAVRSVRGETQHREIAYLIDALSMRLEGKPEAVVELHRLKKELGVESTDVYLAKGELRGSGAPFWRSKPILKGIGFNCDYPDAEGPARDLRTGRPLTGSDKPLPLIQKGDHLITSGLDGVFPPGLSVAIVKSVSPLKEGSFSYEIEAIPTAKSLNDLRVVFVLPSLSGEE